MSRKSDRQERALDRLQEQLKSGKKTLKKTNEKVLLSESDKRRIEKEIERLKK